MSFKTDCAFHYVSFVLGLGLNSSRLSALVGEGMDVFSRQNKYWIKNTLLSRLLAVESEYSVVDDNKNVFNYFLKTFLTV